MLHEHFPDELFDLPLNFNFKSAPCTYGLDRILLPCIHAKKHLPNTTEMYGDGPTTDPRELRDEVGLPPVVYMVRPTLGKV